MIISSLQGDLPGTMDRIIVEPDICNGQPTIKGARITARTVLEFLAAGDRDQGRRFLRSDDGECITSVGGSSALWGMRRSGIGQGREGDADGSLHELVGLFLPDFLIGAHAFVERLPLLTHDERRYRQAFRGLRLISP